MIFLAIDETDMQASLVAPPDVWVAAAASRKQASGPSETVLADEERLARIHLQAGDE